MKLVVQSLILLGSIAFVFVWQNSPLASYTIPLLGFLVFLFLLLSARKKGFNPIVGNNELFGVFTLNTVILLLILSTGEFSSPLYFLLYFVEFGIAFVFEPPLVFLFVVCVTALFISNALQNDPTGNIIRLGSLALLSPLAFLFGKEYKQKEKTQKSPPKT